MSGFEYRVVPAPMRGLKGKGIKGTQARFAHALQTVMNEMGAEGWEYQRTDTLPVEERQGLTGKTTTYQNLLVFRRLLVDDSEEAPDVGDLIEEPNDDVEVVIAAPVRPEKQIAPQPDEPAETSADKADDPSVLKADARERVSETLKADPFVFPWNRRIRPSEKGDGPEAPASPEDAH